MTRLLRTWRLEFEKEAVTGIAKPDRSAVEDLEQRRRENPGRRQARGVKQLTLAEHPHLDRRSL